MKVLNEMETGMVSGGGDLTCDNPAFAAKIDGLSQQVISEIGDFFSGLNQLGSDLGVWLYNMTHNC